MSDLFTAVSRYAGNGAKSHDLSYDLKVLPVPTGSSICMYKVLPVPTGSSFCVYIQNDEAIGTGKTFRS